MPTPSHIPPDRCPSFDSIDLGVPERIDRLVDLRRAQAALVDLARRPHRRESVGLTQSIGRVLSHAVPLEGRTVIPAGMRIEVQHLPLLAAAGALSVDVFARVRVGVVTAVDEQENTHGAVVGTMITGLVEQLGAQAFRSVYRHDQPESASRAMDMFLGDCDLVVFAGFITPTQCAAVRESLARTDPGVRIDEAVLRPFGALQVVRARGKLAIALSADLASAFNAFVMLVSPIVRQLQGRIDPIPDQRTGALLPYSVTDDSGPFLARELVTPLRRDALLEACAATDVRLSLAAADGLAWRPADLTRSRGLGAAYFPFQRWLA